MAKRIKCFISFLKTLMKLSFISYGLYNSINLNHFYFEYLPYAKKNRYNELDMPDLETSSSVNSFSFGYISRAKKMYLIRYADLPLL